MRMRNMLLTVAVLAVCPWAAPLDAAEPKPIPPDQFDKLHKMIKPQPGESRWMEIPWLTSVWEARQKAAAAGKPILLWYGDGSAPIGPC